MPSLPIAANNMATIAKDELKDLMAVILIQCFLLNQAIEQIKTALVKFRSDKFGNVKFFGIQKALSSIDEERQASTILAI